MTYDDALRIHDDLIGDGWCARIDADGTDLDSFTVEFREGDAGRGFTYLPYPHVLTRADQYPGVPLMLRLK